MSPFLSSSNGDEKQLGVGTDATSPAEASENNGERKQGVEKHITWCHRMRNTRDHAEIPELLEILGISTAEIEGPQQGKRWDKALVERKGVSRKSVVSGNGGKEEVPMEFDFGRRLSRGSRASSEKLMGNGVEDGKEGEEGKEEVGQGKEGKEEAV